MKNQLKEFVEYFLEFYGPDGIYPDCHGQKRINEKMVYEGISIVILKSTTLKFEFDSIDRERVLREISGVIA